jgi:leader peptidase (prepilin peptidase)/N-methyltransferase
MTLPGLALGLVFSLFVPLQDLVTSLLPGIAGWRDPAALWRWLSLGDSLLGALVGAGFIYGAGVLYLHARGVEGMGFGDVKLMAMVGAFLGVRLTLLTIFLASLLGAVFGLSSMLVVWLKRTRRRMQRQHESGGVARQRAWVSARIMLRHYQMPFGVFLGSVAIIAVFAGEPFFHWYWSQF